MPALFVQWVLAGIRLRLNFDMVCSATSSGARPLFGAHLPGTSHRARGWGNNLIQFDWTEVKLGPAQWPPSPCPAPWPLWSFLNGLLLNAKCRLTAVQTPLLLLLPRHP